MSLGQEVYCFLGCGALWPRTSRLFPWRI